MARVSTLDRLNTARCRLKLLELKMATLFPRRGVDDYNLNIRFPFELRSRRIGETFALTVREIYNYRN